MTKYRPEIDGLRAVAIIPVVLFHAGVPGFPGGYVGVDVFFVISGYLITSIILEELKSGTFSFVSFYKRRMRRIFPALFTMLTASFALAFILLPPSEMQQFSESMIASVFFYSNHFFLDHSGYFATAAERTPLLHTWSLAVEEQFYFVFPVLLLLTWRLAPKLRLTLLALLAASSLALAQYYVVREPSAAFYLLLTRFWELILGAIAAHLHSAEPPLRTLPNAASREVLTLLGMGFILAAVFLFGAETPFPGLAALLPTLGALLIILFSGTGDLAGRLLASPLPVFIGLMSYSLYLWHYPLLAFARRFPSGDNPALLASIVIASALAAWLSYRFVETPIRSRLRLSTLQIYAASLAAIALIAGMGLTGSLTGGYRSFYINHRLDADTRHNFERYAPLAERGAKMEKDGDNAACVFRFDTVDDPFVKRFDDCARLFGKAVVLIGDSHAINIHNALFKAGVGPFFVSVAQGGCRPYKKRDRCGYERFLSFTAERTHAISMIVLHLSGSHLVLDHLGRDDKTEAFLPGNAWSIDEHAVSGTLAYIESLPMGIPVIWLGPFAEARLDLDEPASYSPERMRFSVVSLAIFSRLDARLKEVSSGRQRYRYVSAVDALGFGEQSLVQGDCLTFQDVDHFSACGEKLFGPALARALSFR